ncbi:LLM class flavin-dependent oxidoreductase [Pseudonocardia sp. RS11V-5]|uniref:LLM class flavin-dependent oxidoreductase n=1 Tax=Pseudonocardia terrae TaxID=2905831 RepID=UPI001E30AEED|nr:LLM class flavin-dependent oxidoreductase [Pseudonocardia terrae]MCE3555840.1 LLM class flavin-dependent oxidoreductase [Pseudonocardia terrae]
MPDYRHDLLFGAFVTPVADPPDQAVELAVAADRAGLDLVALQDHPYLPQFLDAWTLLSVVAARTERIRLTGDVLNLPLRPPAVLARSAASLDRLSGGRLELGLGAGAFWDGIEAMGGRRLAPGQAVTALEEAIAILRGLWATDERGGVRVDGEFHHVAGAKRAPAPGHDIGIWIGALGPRMLRLVGRLADGWLPSLSYLPEGPASLTAMNALIDEGASAAGRDPAAVRRLLNVEGRFAQDRGGLLVGPPEQWADELADLALAEGVSGFVLMSDDRTTLERYAHEVAPRTRELVEAERRG